MYKMAKGIIATLKEALLQEGINLDIVNHMLQSRTGRLYFVLDTMEKLIGDIAHRTKLLLDQGKIGDFQTLAGAIESLRNPMKDVEIVKETPEKMKREIVENFWFPVKKLRTESKQSSDTYIIIKKRKVGDRKTGYIKLKERKLPKASDKEDNTDQGSLCLSQIPEVSGLDVLAQAAASCTRVPDLAVECPTLAKLLNDQ